MPDFIRSMLSAKLGCINLQRRGYRLVIMAPGPRIAVHLKTIADWLAARKVRVLVAGTLPLTQEAVTGGIVKMKARRNKGKYVLTVADAPQ